MLSHQETNEATLISRCALPWLQELQRCESERRGREKERTECSLRIKELEHKIAKFIKDSREATQKVCVWEGGRGGRERGRSIRSNQTKDAV